MHQHKLTGAATVMPCNEHAQQQAEAGGLRTRQGWLHLPGAWGQVRQGFGMLQLPMLLGLSRKLGRYKNAQVVYRAHHSWSCILAADQSGYAPHQLPVMMLQLLLLLLLVTCRLDVNMS